MIKAMLKLQQNSLKYFPKIVKTLT